MRDLAGAGQPVDPVTVAWEAARRGVDVDVRDLDGGMGPLAMASARLEQASGPPGFWTPPIAAAGYACPVDDAASVFVVGVVVRWSGGDAR